MDDIEFNINTNRLEILILDAERSLLVGKITEKKLKNIETLQNTFKLIIRMRQEIHEINKKNTLIALQNVKAYKETAELKNKLTNFMKKDLNK